MEEIKRTPGFLKILFPIKYCDKLGLGIVLRLFELILLGLVFFGLSATSVLSKADDMLTLIIVLAFLLALVIVIVDLVMFCLRIDKTVKTKKADKISREEKRLAKETPEERLARIAEERFKQMKREDRKEKVTMAAARVKGFFSGLCNAVILMAACTVGWAVAEFLADLFKIEPLVKILAPYAIWFAGFGLFSIVVGIEEYSDVIKKARYSVMLHRLYREACWENYEEDIQQSGESADDIFGSQDQEYEYTWGCNEENVNWENTGYEDWSSTKSGSDTNEFSHTFDGLTAEEAHSVYKKKIRELHPDNGGSEEKCKELTAAYNEYRQANNF